MQTSTADEAIYHRCKICGVSFGDGMHRFILVRALIGLILTVPFIYVLDSRMVHRAKNTLSQFSSE